MSENVEIKGLKSSEIWNYENAFYWFSDISRINKILAHFEIYKMIVDKPGDVIELGVYKGVSLTRLLTYRNSLESDVSRKIVGFDTFGVFPRENLTLREDRDFVDNFEEMGGKGLTLEEARFIYNRKGFQNFDLVAGDVFKTIPEYIEKNPHLRISLLHLDMDVQEPTEFALNMLYSRIVPGGLIVVDDYNVVAGATEVIDRFVRKNNLKLEKLPFGPNPSFIRV
jgi:hypothetical protein